MVRGTYPGDCLNVGNAVRPLNGEIYTCEALSRHVVTVRSRENIASSQSERTSAVRAA
jgi:hypothetical protein